MDTILTTGCKALDWMIARATEYTSDDVAITYQFKGNVPFRMRDEAITWMRGKDARRVDGKSRCGYHVQIEEDIDVANRWYHATTLHVSSGSYHSTANSVEVMVTIYDYALTDEDLAEIEASK